MKNFLQSNQSMDDSIKELSHLIYRTEAHIYRGELGSASALLANLEEGVERLREKTGFPVATVAIGAQLGFLSGGKIRGRIPGAVVGAILGWLYGQNLASHTKHDIHILESRINDLRELLAVQARRIADSH